MNDNLAKLEIKNILIHLRCKYNNIIMSNYVLKLIRKDMDSFEELQESDDFDEFLR